MLNFPQSTLFGRRIPKQKFYEHLDVSPEIKRLFVDQVRLITWENKLSPDTLNIAVGDIVQEVEVFHIKLTGEELDHRVLTLMDKQIPYHILFLLERIDGKFQLVVNYKEASQGGNNAFQLKKSYETDWMAQDELPVAYNGLDMDAVYESIVRSIAGELLSTPEAESLQEAVAQTQEKERIEKEIEKLKSKMKKEKRLAKQMEMRREIQKLEAELWV